MDDSNFDNIKIIGDILLSKGINIFEKKIRKTDDPTYHKNYYLQNRDKLLEQAKMSYWLNGGKEKKRIYNEKNKDRIKQRNHLYYLKHKKHLKICNIQLL